MRAHRLGGVGPGHILALSPANHGRHQQRTSRPERLAPRQSTVHAEFLSLVVLVPWANAALAARRKANNLTLKVTHPTSPPDEELQSLLNWRPIFQPQLFQMRVKPPQRALDHVALVLRFHKQVPLMFIN